MQDFRYCTKLGMPCNQVRGQALFCRSLDVQRQVIVRKLGQRLVVHHVAYAPACTRRIALNFTKLSCGLCWCRHVDACSIHLPQLENDAYHNVSTHACLMQSGLACMTLSRQRQLWEQRRQLRCAAEQLVPAESGVR